MDCDAASMCLCSTTFRPIYHRHDIITKKYFRRMHRANKKLGIFGARTTLKHSLSCLAVYQIIPEVNNHG